MKKLKKDEKSKETFAFPARPRFLLLMREFYLSESTAASTRLDNHAKVTMPPFLSFHSVYKPRRLSDL
jgi:hypothetical protein